MSDARKLYRDAMRNYIFSIVAALMSLLLVGMLLGDAVSGAADALTM